jgi:chromosome segregation ATPase
MGSIEELEGRVTALEVQMRTVRQDAAAARVLAGGADRDVSALATKLDAQTRLMEALRETQVEDHGHIIELQKGVGRLERRFEISEQRSEQRFGRLEQQVGGLTARFDGLEGRFDGQAGRFDGLEGRVGGLEQRFDAVDQRLEGVDQRFDGVYQRFDRVDERFDGIDQRFDGIDQRFDGIEGRFTTLEQGQAMILDLLRRSNGEGPPASAE